MRSPIRIVLNSVTLSVLVATAACGPSHRLGEYDFRDRTVAVVSEVPTRPDVLTGSYFIGGITGDPVRDVLRAGARVYREVESRRLRERLESAATRIDVGHVLEDNTLERVARYLGAGPVGGDDDPDFLLELVVVEYGIDAESWDAAAHFYIEADATLLQASTGEEIWRKEIDASERIGSAVFGPGRTVRDVVTAATLADLTVEEIVLALESLADFSGRVITDELREDLRDVRGR